MIVVLLILSVWVAVGYRFRSLVKSVDITCIPCVSTSSDDQDKNTEDDIFFHVSVYEITEVV